MPIFVIYKKVPHIWINKVYLNNSYNNIKKYPIWRPNIMKIVNSWPKQPIDNHLQKKRFVYYGMKFYNVGPNNAGP